MFVQQITETCVYYAFANNSINVVALNAIAAEESEFIANAMIKMLRFLDYVASILATVLTFNGSSKLLNINRSLVCFLVQKARSLAGGY